MRALAQGNLAATIRKSLNSIKDFRDRDCGDAKCRKMLLP